MTAGVHGLESYLKSLRDYFIVERADYANYTAEDQSRAIAYRILACAAIEGHVEDMCQQTAIRGLDQFSKGKTSRCSRSLLAWYSVNRKTSQIALDAPEMGALIHVLAKVSDEYKKLVKRSHGIGEDHLRTLVAPLGVHESEIDVALVDSLSALAEKRNPVSHRRIVAAKQLGEPKSECTSIEGLIPLVAALEAVLQGTLDSA